MASKGENAASRAKRGRVSGSAGAAGQVPEPVSTNEKTPVTHHGKAKPLFGAAALIFSKGKAQAVIEGISLFAHGVHGVLAHLVILIPDTPIKGVTFLGVLGVLVHWDGIHNPGAQPQCFACLSFLAVLSVGLILVALRSPGRDERLQEGQDARVRALQAKPLPYDRQRSHEDTRDNQR